ncbi:MAG: hypothetical protein U9R37_00315 [Campylobacterota bacterium]|nr:hypothetical protein [Campylobacterota bacterium]
MKAIIALEELIKENEQRVTSIKKQLASHESGENKLSYMVKASAETNLQEYSEHLEKHKTMLAELMTKDLVELEKKEKIKEAIERKNYYHFQKTRIKRNNTRSNDEKIEAMMIIDELPDDLTFEDDEIFDIAVKTIKLHLRVHEELHDQLKDIKEEFENIIKDIQKDEENIDDIVMLNAYIPIVVLHFSVLILNIKENIDTEELSPFRGLPRFNDWWIEELWKSHQAYFGLYKWKSIISNMCITTDQKNAWEIIFQNWLSIKKMINNKGTLGFRYNFAFDHLMRKFVELEEELDINNIERMDKIIQNITEKEDFTSVAKEHNISTNYMLFKKEKIDNK